MSCFNYHKILLLFYLIKEQARATQNFNDPFFQNNFRCGSGKYIYNHYFCNGSPECEDGSDEGLGCDKKTCGIGKFKCGNGSCKNIIVRCDTIKDCEDGSDEFKCGDEIKVDDCHLREGSFLCEDKLKCIDLVHICNGFCNCLDCSDEKIGCAKYDNFLCNLCSDTCYMSVNDYYRFSTPPSNLGKNCSACFRGKGCEQKCFSFEPLKDRCLCDENFRPASLNFNHQTDCLNNVPYENLIVYSTMNKIKVFNLTSNETKTILKEVNCTALSAASNYIYYAIFTNNVGRINKISINTGINFELIQCGSLVNSISVDWITSNIYYTTNTSLNVCGNEGLFCVTLKSSTNRNVKVIPKLGRMIWSENMEIRMSAMDGTSERILITDEFPTQRDDFMVVDEWRENVYWLNTIPFAISIWNLIDSTYDIAEWDFEESTRNWSVFSEFENRFYLVEESSYEILFSQPEGEFSVRVIDDEKSIIKQIYVYNPLLHRTRMLNPCMNKPCSGLCLLRPTFSTKGLNYTCVCENVSPFDGNCTITKLSDTSTSTQATGQKFVTKLQNGVTSTISPQKDFVSEIKIFSFIFLFIVIIVFSIGVYFTLQRQDVLKDHVECETREMVEVRENSDRRLLISNRDN